MLPLSAAFRYAVIASSRSPVCSSNPARVSQPSPFTSTERQQVRSASSIRPAAFSNHVSESSPGRSPRSAAAEYISIAFWRKPRFCA